ncbi:MAG TPA: hypothetical protein VGQ35_08380 [Dongiaceae bacterium]|jgi:uncharacterized protein YjiS (DUF1127 family)|nr:hypothetical protein [Dongiaceae bacterium]
MTISQPSSSQGTRPYAAVSLGRLIRLALTRWRERRRAKIDLARLAEAGDYLLLDVGLDPKLARENPGALLDQITRARD